jgi:hypothetical protein
MAEVTLGTLYDLNKQAMLLEPVLTVAEKAEAIDKLVEELLNNISSKAYMCLNNEKRDFTIFLNTQIPKMKGHIRNDIREFLDNRGDLISIEKQEDGAYEIWLKNNAECFCYMFFDYTDAIIEY